MSLYAMVVLYAIAGIMHFVKPESYLSIMPPWLPWHKPLVFFSGACEIAFGVLLLFPLSRHFAAACIIALLVAVFPANIQMAINFYKDCNPYLWLAIARLPLQIVLIWWAYGVFAIGKK